MGFEPPHVRAARWRLIRWRLIVVFATLIAFSPVVHHEFGGWDDEQNLTLNPQMNPPTLSAVANYWRAPKFDLYVPLTWTVWSALASASYDANAPSLDAHLNPYIFHTANLALHAASAFLAFELLRRLLGKDALVASAAGALLFALHPVLVEPVAWVSGLKDVLSGMLALVAMILFLDSTRDVKNHWRGYSLAMIVFALALLSKPSAVVVPAMLVVVDVFIRRSPLRRSLLRFAPAFVLAVIACVLARAVQQAHHLPSVEWWQRPLIALDAIGFYLAKIMWPLRLGVDYGRTPQRVVQIFPRGFWFVPLLVATCRWLYSKMRGRYREQSCAVLSSVLLLVIGVAPVLGLIPFDFQEYSTVADHYLYLAMLGPALLLAQFVIRTKRSIVGTIFIVICGTLTWRQAGTWHDALSISEQAIVANPASKPWGDRLTRLLLESANESARQGDDVHASATYYRVLDRDPNNAIALANLASVLASNGRARQAIPLYERALQIDPSLESARLGLERARAEADHSRPE